MKNNKDIKFVFWGTDEFSVIVLEELEKEGFLPSLIVTAPDRPAGRGQKMQSSPAKKWAGEKNVAFLQPEKLNAEFIKELKTDDWPLFTLASYGKIIPQEVLDIPTRGTLNVHPSLLPLYRGASPIESAILDDSKETGVTIMLMDEKMDHGPIINQELVDFDEWPPRKIVEEELARIGGKLLADSIIPWIAEEIEEQDQEHEMATFTKKIKKEDGLIDLSGDDRKNFLKVQAMNPWPGAYFFIKKDDKEIRIKITKAKFVDGKFVIEKIIPEGKKEMNYSDFQKS